MRSLGYKNRNRRGSILVLVLSVLSLMSLLATSVVALQGVSKMESARYIEKLEASLLAQMGFERAVAELKNNPFNPDIEYWGRDMNKNEQLDDLEAVDVNGDGYFDESERDIWTVPPEWATNPSFAYTGDQGQGSADDNDTDPELVKVIPSWARSTETGKSIKVGVSGFASKSTYIPMGNAYSVRVVDLQSRIYLNDGLEMYGGNQSSVSQNLKRILNVLVGHPDVLGDEAPTTFGQELIDNRPLTGFKSKYEVLRIMQSLYGPDKGEEFFKKLEPYVTVFAWVDKNVVNPVPLSNEVYQEYPVLYYRAGNSSDVGISPAVRTSSVNKPYLDSSQLPSGYDSDVVVFRRGRGKNSNNKYMFNRVAEEGGLTESLRWFNPMFMSGTSTAEDTHNAIYGYDELFPQYIEVVHRAPVNINNASEPVLTALIADISGFFVVERRRFAPFSGSARDFNITTKATFQDSELEHSATIPQKFETWKFGSHTYDSGGYDLESNGSKLTEIKSDGDELGYIYKTVPFKAEWQVSKTDVKNQEYIDARLVAKHIIAARKEGSYEGINYIGLPFSGKFTKWSQFNKFIDNLVEREVIKDTRSIYWNYLFSGWETPEKGDWSDEGIVRYPISRDDPAQQEFASYAIADALKANFNPNLHLNEANPDANLWLRVDKTDLIVNSTEFCFTPMGYFEIESVGRIFEPAEKNATGTVFDGVVVKEASQAKVEGIVKVFDVYRETSQRHFMQGKVSSKKGTQETNSGSGLELAPEVYNSIAFKGKEGTYGTEDNYGGYKTEVDESIDGYKGYSQLEGSNSKLEMGWGAEYAGHIQLSTLGGMSESEGILSGSRKGTISDTPAGTAHWPVEDLSQYEGMHAHFSWDFKAHHHASAVQLGDQYRDEVSSKTLTSGKFIGKVDPALLKEDYGVNMVEGSTIIKDEYFKDSRSLRYNLGNYKKIERTSNFADDDKELPGPYDSKYEHRLARSFRLPMEENGKANTSTYNLPRLSTYAPTDLRVDGAYVERNAGLAYWVDEGYSMFSHGGAVSMWLKPSFFPEHTGKVRKLFSYDRWHKANYSYKNPNMFSLLFFPAHDSPPSTAPEYETETLTMQGVYTTNKDAAPVESVTTGDIGVKGFRSSSLMGGIFMHQAAGSLEDWEYDVYSTRNSTLWNESKTHVVDIEKYYNTPSLNHNLHPDGLGSASRPNYGSSYADPERNYLEAHKWIHVIYTWNVKYDYRFNMKYPADGAPDDSGSQNEKTTKKKAGKKGSVSILGGTNGLSCYGCALMMIKGSGEITNPTYQQHPSEGGQSEGGQPPDDYELIPVNTYEHVIKIYVNGKELSNSSNAPDGSSSFFIQGGRRPTFSVHSFEDENKYILSESYYGSGYWRSNTLRVGETSFHGFPMDYNANNSDLTWQRNFSGDFTVDELMVHGSADETDAGRQSAMSVIESSLKGVYAKGRYYVPRTVDSGGLTDSVFESAPIYLNSESGNSKSSVFGVQWTWLAEDYEGTTNEPLMYDYSSETLFNGKKTGIPLRQGLEGENQAGAMVRVGLSVYDKDGYLRQALGGKGGYRDSGYSDIKDPLTGKMSYKINEGDYLQYKVIFNIEGADPDNSVLLSSPIFDDVTIFYSSGVKVMFYMQSAS